MRLLTLFLPTLALSTLFPALVSSIHPHALAHRRDYAQSPASSLIASRQYRVPRDLLDVCINVNANLLADASQLLGLSSLLGALNLGADIQLCLCLKDLEIYLDTNDQLSALIGLLGKNTVGALITALINTSPEAKQCTFPQHAHHTCNTSDPCHYACDPPYISDGSQCVCAPPNVSCNGVCGEFTHGCSSAVPRSLATKSQAITTLAQAQASCKAGESVCGIPGSENTLLFECVDVSSTKDSCGGCMTPHPFYEAEPVRFSSGRDCSVIPNSKSTTCSSSRCIVNACSDGWVPSMQKDACVPAIVGSKMRRVRKRLEASSNEDVDSQITAVVKVVVALNLHGPYTVLTSNPTSYSSDDLASIESIYGLVDGVNAATSGLLTSTSVSGVISYATTLLDTSKLLQATVAGCSHVNNIQAFSDDVGHVISAVNDLLASCHEHPNSSFTLRQSIEARGSSPISSLGSSLLPSSPSSSSESSAQPIIAGLTSLLSGLGIEGKSGAAVDGLVGDGTANTVNNLLDGLGLGPANYKRQAIPPITALVNATLGGDSGLLNQLTVIINLVINLTNSAPGASATSPSTTTASLGSSVDSTDTVGPLSHCQIDPLIYTSLYQYSIDLIESPDLDSLCRNTEFLYGVACSLRDLFEGCPYVDALGLGSVEADLLLVVQEILYLDNYCNANIGAGSHGNGSNGSSGHSSVILTTLTTATFASTSTSFSVGTTLSASVGVHTSFVGVSTSVQASSTTSYTPSVTSASSNNPTPTSPGAAASTDISIVVSADEVLSGLGLGGTKAVVTVDGLLGNDLDQSVDQLLDGLNIGPHNVRRHDGRRQIVASVNATVDLGGLGGVVDGLVNLVLGLTNVGSVLPPIPGLLHSSSPPPLTTTTPLAANPAVPAVPAPVPALPVPLPPLSSIPLLPLSDPVSSLVDQSLVTNVVTALLSLLSLQSPTYAQLLHALDNLVAASSSSASAISGCSCVKELEGYDDVYRYLVDITQATEALETLCGGRATGSNSSANGVTSSSVGTSHLATPTGSQPSASTSTSSSVDEPLVVGLTKLLKGLGLNIPAKVVVDGLLSNGLDHTLNGVLDGLGIGPNGARRRSQQDW